ncbi:MAG: LamG-like jellyroll fold domain-containing protein [Bacteroidia bacterium]
MKKLVLLASFIISSLIACAQIPTINLVGYWPMNGDLNDYSSYNNNGTNYGATLVCDRCGNKDMAYHFDGITSSVVVNNSASIDMTNNTDFSISFWMKVYSNPTADGSPINKNLYGSWSGYAVMTNNTNPGYCLTSGQASFYTASGAGQDACSNSAISLGNAPDDIICTNGWIYITCIYDGNLQISNFYVNSVLQNDVGAISGNLSNVVNLVFGAHPAGLAFFKGDIDDMRIYRTKLTQANINALYTEDCLITGIKNQQQIANTLKAYPNPTNGLLNLFLENINATVQIFNSLGQVILNEKVTNQNFSYNLLEKANGVYTLKVIYPSKTQVIKVVKE